MLKTCIIDGKGQLCGEKTGMNTALFFKGPSLYWSDGNGAPFYSVETVDWFVDNMEIGIIRAAMAIRYYGNGIENINIPGGVSGYHWEPARQRALVEAVIDAAIVNDIYVIVDWHSHNAHQDQEPAQAVEFFREMATKYKDVPNIIWEVYNEPVNASLAEITNYSNSVISAIRGAGSQHLVLIGSPQWSKQPYQQAQNWGDSRDQNVAFTFHFYAASHAFPNGDGIGTSSQNAMNAGYSIFGSEWGAVNANGGGSVNTSATNTWTNWMDENKVSNCMWNASSLNEGSSMFTSGTDVTNLSTSRLTASGQYFQTYMAKNKWTTQIPANHPMARDFTTNVKAGESVIITPENLGIDGVITGVSEVKDVTGTVYGLAEVLETGIRYTALKGGFSAEKVRFTYTVSKNSIITQGRVTINITDNHYTQWEITVYLANQWLKSDGTPTTIELYQNDVPIMPAIDSIVYEGKKLAEGIDYEIIYHSNVKIDNEAKIVIIGKGNYYDNDRILRKILDFYITDPRDIANTTIIPNSIPAQLATGSEIKPQIEIRDYSSTVILREDIDYILDYVDNTAPGTATIQIVGIGIYQKTFIEVPFSIVDKKELSSTTATIPTVISAITYDGTKHMPDITVIHNQDGILTEGTDYTVSYGDNINAGTNVGTVIATGIGDYSGTISKNFTIDSKALNAIMVAEIPVQEYTGSQIMPIVTLTDGTKTLILDSDYTVAYLNNRNPSENAIVNITGIGNYAGQIITNFTISSEGTTPVAVSRGIDALFVSQYYTLKGTPLGTQKPVTSGVYVEKMTGQMRIIMVK